MCLEQACEGVVVKGGVPPREGVRSPDCTPCWYRLSETPSPLQLGLQVCLRGECLARLGAGRRAEAEGGAEGCGKAWPKEKSLPNIEVPFYFLFFVVVIVFSPKMPF